tara:strand:- start:10 stop:402 length:393 start_codon:yes stop_codon:yes gene_type:complete
VDTLFIFLFCFYFKKMSFNAYSLSVKTCSDIVDRNFCSKSSALFLASGMPTSIRINAKSKVLVSMSCNCAATLSVFFGAAGLVVTSTLELTSDNSLLADVDWTSMGPTSLSHERINASIFQPMSQAFYRN